MPEGVATAHGELDCFDSPDPFSPDREDTLAIADQPSAPPARAYLVPHPSTFRNYTCCPWASSRIVRDVETGQPILCAVTCKRWGCSYCAPRRIKKLAFLTRGAEPNRWIRLGVNPALYPDPETAWRETSPAFPEAIRLLRKECGEIEYLRVCELHEGTTRYSELPASYKAKGFPHYHALLRSPFIRQKQLSQIWGDLTGAPVVWIAKIDQTFSSFRYLTKYLTKLHRLEWTDRHVSYSRNFFREEDREKLAFPQRDLLESTDVHPWKLLADRYAEQEIATLPDGTWRLPPHRDLTTRDVPMHELGLRLPPGQKYQPPPQPRYLATMEDAHDDDYSSASF